MTAVGIVWVIVTPYCTGLLVAGSHLVNRIVSRHLRVSTTLGWAGLGTLFAGVFAVGGHTGMTMAVAGAPFAGLAVWKLRPSGDDDGPEPPEPDDPPPPHEDVRPSQEQWHHHRRHHARPAPLRPARTRTSVRGTSRGPRRVLRLRRAA
jgi:hypothetical protein